MDAVSPKIMSSVLFRSLPLFVNLENDFLFDGTGDSVSRGSKE